MSQILKAENAIAVHILTFQAICTNLWEAERSAHKQAHSKARKSA